MCVLQATIAELSSKIADMEDRSRRSNLLLVGLKEGAEGGDAVSFLETNTPKWLPSLSGSPINIETANRIYSCTGRSNTPRMLIFEWTTGTLNYRDRQLIIKAAGAADSLQHGESRISFYPDYSLETTKKRKAFSETQFPRNTVIPVLYLKWPTAAES